MKKHDILYDWPIAELSRLADSQVAETFYNGLVEPAASEFVKIAEVMRGLAHDLSSAKATLQHCTKWTDIRVCLNDFESQFSAFSDTAFRKFHLFIALAEKTASSGDPLDAIDVDENVFTIRQLSDQFPLVWFHRENTVFEHSCCVFSCRNVAEMAAAVDADTLSPRFAFHFLASLCNVIDVPDGHSALVNNVVPEPDSTSVDAFAKLVVLASGSAIHSRLSYGLPPSVVDPDCFRVGEPYQQWAEVLHVLSEYNSRTDVLLKYLTIYHAIENFMFKRPIVELESKLGGQMFSIRDFRRLYQQVERKEGDAIKELFRTIGTVTLNSGLTFADQWWKRWNSVFPAALSADVDYLLGRFGVRFTFSEVTLQTIGARLPVLVYAVRNAVVHNKETEFHLTYASMDNTLQKMIGSFLIPSLEEVCFEVIGRRNPDLWYSQDKLMFYK